MKDKSVRLEDFVRRDAEKLRDIAFPLKSGLLRRLLVRRYPCSRLHPNPDDEFWDPAIGPSYPIIQEYARMFKRGERSALLTQSRS